MIFEVFIGPQYIFYHEAQILIGIGRMNSILRHYLRQTVDEIPLLRNTQPDIEIFQTYFRIEAPHHFQGGAAKHQRRGGRDQFPFEKNVIEIKPQRHDVALLLFAVRQKPSFGIDEFDVAAAYPRFGMRRHVRGLRRDPPRQHDVVRTERHDQAAFGALDGGIERAAQPLIVLGLKIEPEFGLQTGYDLDTAVAGAVIDHQQFQIRVILRQHAANRRFDIAGVIV